MLDLILQPPPTQRKSFFVSIFCGWGISASKELGCHLTFIAMVEMFRGLLGPAREEGMLISGHRVLAMCAVLSKHNFACIANCSIYDHPTHPHR